MNIEQANPGFNTPLLAKMFFKSWLMPKDQDTFLIEFGQQYKLFKLTENISIFNNAPLGHNTTIRKLTLEEHAVNAILNFKNNFDKNQYSDFIKIGLSPTYNEINLTIPKNIDTYKKYKILRKSISESIAELIKESNFPKVFGAIHGNESFTHWDSIILTDPYIQRLLDMGQCPILSCSSLDIRICKKIFVSFNVQTENPSMLQFGHIPFKDSHGKSFEFSVIQTLPVLGVINVEGI